MRDGLGTLGQVGDITEGTGDRLGTSERDQWDGLGTLRRVGDIVEGTVGQGGDIREGM